MTSMRAMVLETPRSSLVLLERVRPEPKPGQMLVRVEACGVCRTDLHIVDGELTTARLPRVLGHQVVGIIVALGADCGRYQPGDRVGIAWLGGACGECRFCRGGRENLCDQALFTGCHVDGGFAEYAVAREEFCFPMPAESDALRTAPLLCAGLIGYRALRMTGDAQRLGFYGFGAAAHILAQVARFQGRSVSAFVRPGDERGRRFALDMGCDWAGFSTQTPPQPLDAAIIFAPAGELVPAALRAVDKGGVVVCGGIHMSDIPSFPYEILWGERVLRSVANLTQRDGEEFLALAARVPVRTAVKSYPLEAANDALDDLRSGRLKGAAVLEINGRLGGASDE